VDKEICENCRYWNRLLARGDAWGDEIIYFGTCKFGPPTASEHTSRENPDGKGNGYWTLHYNRAIFPTTSCDDSCGQFKEATDD